MIPILPKRKRQCLTAAEITLGTTTATANAAVTQSQLTTALAPKADLTATSLTIVKGKNEVAYTDGKPDENQSWAIVDRNDYLLQNANNDKYYYWKHINNDWHLMGGAGGEGSGNTSGYDLTTAEYEAIA